MATHRGTRTVRSWALVSVSVMLTMAAPLAAQQTGQTTQTPPPPASQTGQAVTAPQTPAPSGPTMDLTMDQAVTMAVEANLSLKSSRLNEDIAGENVQGAQAAFKPILLANVSDASQTSLPNSFTQLTSGSISSASASGGFQVQQALPWLGGTYTTSWNTFRGTTTQPAPVFNPQLQSTVQFAYTQPLLRGFRTDANRTTLANDQTFQHFYNLDTQLQTIEITSSVQQAYLTLKATKATVDVAQQNVDLSTKQLNDTKRMLAVGVKAQMDVVSQDLLVQQSKQELIIAQSSVKDAQDQLKSLIFDPNRPDYWTVDINPTDQLVVAKMDIDVDQAVRTALADRLDVKEAEDTLAIAQRTYRLDQNLTETQVNAVAAYSATSSGGTQFTYNGLTDTPSGSTTRNLSTVLSQTFSGAYPSWQVQLNVSYPIGRSAAEASVAAQSLVVKQQELQLADLRRTVEATVRAAVRAVETNYDAVQATHAALDAALQQLQAEQKKQEVGTSDSFTLEQKTLQLINARVVDLQQQIAYNQAILAYQRLLKAR